MFKVRSLGYNPGPPVYHGGPSNVTSATYSRYHIFPINQNSLFQKPQMVSGEFELPNNSFGKTKVLNKYNRKSTKIGSEKLRKPKWLEA